METTTKTLRDKALEAVLESAQEMSRLEHIRNYWKLHVWRDGSVTINEHVNQSEDFIDSGAKRFAPVPSVWTSGTGSCACNCDYCNNVYDAEEEAEAIADGREYDREGKYTTVEEAILDAVCEGGLGDIETHLISAFEAEIEDGYFDDEE